MQGVTYVFKKTVAGGGLPFIYLIRSIIPVLLLLIIITPTTSSGAENNQIIGINPYSTWTVTMSLPGPYHNLTSGTAGYDMVSKTSSGAQVVLNEERNYAAALTADGRITVENDFKAKYETELKALSGGGWIDVAMSGISHYDRTAGDSYNSTSTPAGFYLAAVDSQGKIHVSPTFKQFNGALPSSSVKYQSITAIQQSAEKARPAIIGIDTTGRLHMPEGVTIDKVTTNTDLDLTLKYKSLYAVASKRANTIFGLTTDGAYPCSLKSNGKCEMSWLQSALAIPEVDLIDMDTLKGPFADVAPYPFGLSDTGYFTQYVLSMEGKLRWREESFSEIAGANIGNDKSTLYGITGKPKSAFSYLSAMPETGVAEGTFPNEVAAISLILFSLLPLLRRRI